MLIRPLSRRGFLATGAAAGATLAMPHVARAQAAEINLIGWNSEPLKAIFARAEAEVGVKVNYDVLPAKWDDVMQKITLWGQTGYDGIDVLFADDLIGGLWGMNGWAEDLSGTHAWTAHEADVVDNIRTLNQAVGGVYRIFFTMGLEPFMFNKALVPQAPKTWDELVSMGQAATDEAAGVWGWRPLGGEGHAFNTVLLMLNQAGADLSTLDDPATFDALKFMHDWVHTYKITPASTVSEDNAVVEALAAAGKAGMWWTYDGGVSNILKVDGSVITPETLGAAPWPSGPAGNTGLVHGWGLLQSKFSKKKDAGRAVIEWMAQPEIIREMCVANSMAPPYRSLFSDPALVAAVPSLTMGPGWEVLIAGAKFREPIVSSPQVTQLWSMFDSLGGYVLSGERTPEDAQRWAVDEYQLIKLG